MIVVGDSMEPTLKDGDYLVLTPLDPYKPHGDRLKDNAMVLIRFTLEHGGGCTPVLRQGEWGDPTPEGQPEVRADPVGPGEDIQSVAVAVERRVKL